MALPKEPRQKMINIMYLVLTAILALNVSAEILEAFKTVDKSLQNSTANIQSGNATLFKSLEDKKNSPESKAKAAIWAPKADSAKILSDNLNTYIEGLKKDLKTEAGLKLVDGKESFKEDNLDASTRLFETNGKGKDLVQKLTDYKTAMLSLDPSIKTAFENNFPVDASATVNKDGKSIDFTTAYFHMTPTVAALTMLSKFQNNVTNAENQVVSYCHSQIGQVQVHMDQVGILVGQNSNYLMPGQELEITAGVGAYSSSASPSISINGSSVPVTAGQGTYKMKVDGSGNKTVSVNVTFKDENGQMQTKTQTIPYTVGTPGGAAVMLDKMNVLYIGVDNPVTISSGSGWDKTHVTIEGGNINGSNGKFTVRVSSPGKATINVNADGKSSNFEFRIKRIPDPIFKVGDGKSRMPAVAFKNQQYCRADLENFDFDLKFSIVSATVYFGGANFPSVQTGTIDNNNLGKVSNLIQKCGPGSSISFENIKVSGPDGVRSIEGRSFQLY